MYNLIADGLHYFEFVEVAGIKYGLVLEKMTGDQINYFIFINKGDNWNTPQGEHIVDEIFDNLDSAKTNDAEGYVQGVVDKVNKALQDYFAAAGSNPSNPSNPNGTPETYTDKLEDSIRSRMLVLKNGIPQMDKKP